jgi:hypothetical protein
VPADERPKKVPASVKKSLFLFLFLILFLSFSMQAQEEDQGGNWEIDSLFDDPPEVPESSPGESAEPEEDILVTLRDKVILEASYEFSAGFAPGWSEAPWYDSDRKFSYAFGAKMDALLRMDFQLSENLQVCNSFSFSVPDKTVFSIKEFYFDYTLNKIVFIRAGMYETSWGISPYFPFTNLPVRIPEGSSGGQSYIGKIDIPIGIGGVQLLGMTREGFMADSSSPTFGEIAYGMKYNLAFPGADIDAGVFYHKKMPLRFFMSLKTTLGNTEVYTEGLAVTSHEAWEGVLFSANAGFVRDFIGGKLTVSGEAFYNGERETAWWRIKTDLKDEEAADLIDGFNAALGFIFRPGIIGMRIFCQCRYSFEEYSAQLVPGISVKPGNLVTASLLVPMALGSRSNKGYYHHNADKNNRPFSITFLVTLGGSFRYSI